MNNYTASAAEERALPCCLIRSQYPELYAFIRAVLSDKCRFDSDCEADIVAEDADGGIILRTSFDTSVVSLERPFSASTLSDAVEALLSRRTPPGFHADAKHLTATLDNISVKLTPTEFRLFSAILESGDEFISADKLSEKVWGRCDRNICVVYVSYLRRKLDGAFGEGTLITASGKGYRLRESHT